MAKLPNPHPGDVLREDYLVPLDQTPEWLASGLRMPLTEVEELLNGDRPITAPIALRLQHFFGASAEFWMYYQAAYDLEEAQDEMVDELNQIERCQMPHLRYDEDGEILSVEAEEPALPSPSSR